MSTPTPKRKRGQHAKRSPITVESLAASRHRDRQHASENDAWLAWMDCHSIYLTLSPLSVLHAAFMAGYRAGKGAK